jgi:TRAP-type uncharacterized transport system fused permease subunit
MSETATAAPARELLETMVAEADTGGRKPTGLAKRVIFTIALCWSLFQLWYASPLPYIFSFGIFNDAQARTIHLTFAFLLAFTTFPALRSSRRDRIPATDWALAILAVIAALYLLVFYREISLRPGMPITADLVVSVIGIVLLLEAARRAVGPALAVIAAIMVAYIFTGPWLPGMLAHKGASVSRRGDRLRHRCHRLFRRGDAGLAAHAESLVRDAAAPAHLLHAVPPGFLARSALSAVRAKGAGTNLPGG